MKTLAFLLLVLLPIAGCCSVPPVFLKAMDETCSLALPEWVEYVEKDPNRTEAEKKVRRILCDETLKTIELAKEKP